jgi:CHASE2 domain-containing sensor protein
MGSCGSKLQPADQRRGASITDADLERLLNRLQNYQPRVIALDLFRDFSTSANHPQLAQQLQQSDRLITLYSYGKAENNPGIAPPPEIATDQISSRVGFSSTPLDIDQRIRRQLLMQSPSTQSVCPTGISFAWLTALRYLKDDGIYLAWTSEETLQMMIDHTIFPPLESYSGGYHQIDARGHQILLNYRPTKSGIARQLTLDQALNGEIDSDWVKDRIVLIGNTDPSFRDFHTTPYSRNAQDSMPGVVIQAHMISQILNVVLNNQPLLQPWNVWGEIAWIVGWAIAGGTFVWVLQSFS